MFPKIFVSRFAAAPLAAALVAALGVGASASTFTLIDGEGFESPSYSTSFVGTGQLEGQFASTLGGFGSSQWVQSPTAGLSTAVVQTAVVASGSQAVEVTRASQSDDRWAVPVVGSPAVERPVICIEWDMYVEESVSTPLGSFGPFFGIEAYDDDATSILRIGSMGVDAATGDVLYTDRPNGLIESGTVVNFDEWNSFQLVLDFTTDRYSGFVNGDLVFLTDFESIGADQFTDADIAAIAASFDPGSDAAVGTAYFDNYFVFETDDLAKLPEPSSAGLLILGFLARGRRRG